MAKVRRNWRGPNVRAAIEANVRTGLLRSAIIMQSTVKQMLNLGGPGPPSPPGRPPHKQSGILGQSVQIDTSRIAGPKPRVRIGPDLARAPYARIHELGGEITPKRAGGFLRFKTHDGNWHAVRRVVMPRRPYLAPSIVEARPRILAEFTPARLLRGT